jgi:hypothetical protein
LNSQIDQALSKAYQTLESCYHSSPGLRVEDFYSTQFPVKTLGTVVCQNHNHSDLDISILLDRDFFSAAGLSAHHYSVLFEELSHFYLISVNHLKNRTTSKLELEAQSEIDRLICSLSLEHNQNLSVIEELRTRLFYSPYTDPVREKARHLATSFLSRLSSTNPAKWRSKDFEKLSTFFHADLPQKFHLARYY